jgi:cation diffusion facilitator CzcD-associated flavoprotein CzcO
MTTIEMRAHPTAGSLFAGWLERLAAAVEAGEGAGDLFVEDCFWKDVLAFTGGYRTFSGRAEIERVWRERHALVRPTGVRAAAGWTPPRWARRSAREVVEATFEVTTAAGRAIGFVRLLPDGEGARAELLLTTLHELHGHEGRVGEHRPENDARRSEAENAGREPEVLVVGAGQAGLTLAARLRQMGVDCLVLEKRARVGDNWRDRYHSLTLHNEVWANHLPYLPFPESFPTFLPKDKLAGWLEAYAELMELNVWTATELEGARYDRDAGRWEAELVKDGERRTIRAPHLVLATGGVSGIPSIPPLAGLDEFAGIVVHSSEFGSGADHRGRRAIVVGTGNSGHDIAQDLHEQGAAAVTMVQRSPTCVVSLTPGARLLYALYSEGLPVEELDLVSLAVPYPLLVEANQRLTAKIRALDDELLGKLTRAGFETDFEDDDTGFYMRYLRKGGGYYIDIGCSGLIGDGKVGLVQARSLDRFDANGVVLRDGSRIDADLVVLATGYENQQEGIRRLLGDEIAERVGPVWGFDENHTMRNVWQGTAQPGLWIMAGDLVLCRIHSRYLALQITAELAGVDLERPAR